MDLENLYQKTKWSFQFHIENDIVNFEPICRSCSGPIRSEWVDLKYYVRSIFVFLVTLCVNRTEEEAEGE